MSCVIPFASLPSPGSQQQVDFGPTPGDPRPYLGGALVLHGTMRFACKSLTTSVTEYRHAVPLLPGDLIFLRSAEVHHYNLAVSDGVKRRSLTAFAHREMLKEHKHQRKAEIHWAQLQKRGQKRKSR